VTAIVIGLFASDSDADIALNNLAEAEFAASSISVLTSDRARTAALTDAKGPWSALSLPELATRLQALGVATADWMVYQDQIAGGACCIAVHTSDHAAAAAAEILVDQHAEQVRTLGPHGDAGQQQRGPGTPATPP